MSALTLVLAFLACAAPAVAQPSKGNYDVGGTYTVHGTNPDGTNYVGTVSILYDDRILRFDWRIGGDTFRGVGQFDGDLLVVNWGHRYPVIYEVGTNGVLYGRWDNGRASEILTPGR